MDADSLDIDKKYYILYPSGSHGHFAKLLLNTMTGNIMEQQESVNFDRIRFKEPGRFVTTHDPALPDHNDVVINIRVRPQSYLKFFVMCFCRTKDLNIVVEDLSQNTFEKINQHPVMKFFADSLAQISHTDHGDVEPKYLREWFRLCFFDNNCETIAKILAGTYLADAEYVLDFESFYDGSIVEQCQTICQDLRLPAVLTNQIDQYMQKFQTNRYYNIDADMDRIISAIQNHRSLDITDLNTLQQAWIDNFVAVKYNVDPWLTNDYFSNTTKLAHAYGI
jgi:hypothetical protein